MGNAPINCFQVVKKCLIVVEEGRIFITIAKM